MVCRVWYKYVLVGPEYKLVQLDDWLCILTFITHKNKQDQWLVDSKIF